MMDLLYFLGTGSTWNDNEIRYSLRSACAHYPHGQVFIVGNFPAWLKGVIHIPISDLSTNKVTNQLNKLAVAVKDRRLSDQFVLMNDDFFFTRSSDFQLPTYVHKTLQQAVTDRFSTDPLYARLNQEALDILRVHGMNDPLSYETHTPMTLDKAKVEFMLRTYGRGKGYAFRSIYGNIHSVPPTLCQDPKLHRWSGVLPDLPVMSIGDDVAKDPRFQIWIAGRWPLPCRYEI